MRLPQWLRPTLLAPLLALSLGTAALPAAAGPVQVRDGNGGDVFNGGPGYRAVTIKVDAGSLSVAAGAFALEYREGSSGGWTSFLTYCLEPDEWLGISGLTPHDGTLATNLASTAEYAASGNAIARMAATWIADSFTSALKSAAFQVALWELAYDSGSNLATGAFQLVGSADVRSQAELYLNAAGWQSAGAFGAILRDGNQDLLFAVPEPRTILLFLVALSGLVFVLSRRWRLARHG